MKKIFLVLVLVGLFSIMRDDAIRVPKEAIRLRVIANSDNEDDQFTKLQVKEKLESDIYTYLKDTKDVDTARRILQSNIPALENNIQNTLIANNAFYDYKINLGLNHFPQKEYRGVIYEEGNYESLVVTLGSGAGNNWWCVLFPPFCLLEAEESEYDDVEYQLLAKKLIDKFLK